MLSLRDMTTDDLDLIVKWRSDPKVNLYLADRLKTREEVDPWFTRVRANPSVWLKIILDDDRPIGYGAVESIDEKSRKCEVALVIGEAAVWGKGVGRTITRMMLDYAFNDLHFHRVVGVVIRGNERSERMIKSLGFTYEGCMREAMFTGGRFHDLLWFGILEDEYSSRTT